MSYDRRLVESGQTRRRTRLTLYAASAIVERVMISFLNTPASTTSIWLPRYVSHAVSGCNSAKTVGTPHTERENQ
jgi:hypothetical protein